MSKSTDKIRIVDIARLAGVSAGTVDRVLHNRGSVSEESRIKIENALKTMNYRPNVYASVLALKKKFQFVCILPIYNEGDYWEKVEEGIRRAADEFAPLNVSMRYIYFNQYDVYSCRLAFEKITQSEPDAVIFPPFFKEESKIFAEGLSERCIPFVFLDSLITQPQPLAYFGQDSFQSGLIAAKLLMLAMQPDSTIALFHTYRIGNLGSNQTLERKKGFLHYLNTHFPECKTVTVELNAVNQEQNRQAIKSLLETNPNITGAVVFNSLTYMVAGYLEESNQSQIQVIGYDLLNHNVEYMKKGVVNYLIAQRPEVQGYNGVKALCDFLVFKQPVKQINYMPIDILTGENINYYTSY
jgi:Transcriptional regulators